MSLGPISTLLLVPPMNLLPMAMGGLVLMQWRPRLGRAVTATAVMLTWVLSTGVASSLLIGGLERGILVRPDAVPEAIVILSAELQRGALGSLVPGTDVGPMTLERIRAGARLARQTHLPVLTSGGGAESDRPSLAEAMSLSLKRDFAISVSWVETGSEDTWQNATASAAILKEANIRVVYLVTDAWHMRRALIAFRHAGLIPIAAPVRMQTPMEFESGDLLPTPKAWLWSYLAIHEWIGSAFYALRAHFT